MKRDERFLSAVRRNWLARLFQNATLVLLAGAVGGELFLKLELLWRLVLVAGIIAVASLGLWLVTEKNPESEEGD